jgi:hypothetical protein
MQFPPIFNQDQVSTPTRGGLEPGTAPALPPAGAPGPSSTALNLDDSPPGTISFDRIDRISYVAPPTSGQIFNIFQVRRDISSGFITRLGIGSPQIDWFGQNEYQFVLDQAPPYDQQLAASGNILAENTFFAFIPIGTFEVPKRVRILINAGQIFQLKVRPQATPAANVVVYNVFIRSSGFFYK